MNELIASADNDEQFGDDGVPDDEHQVPNDDDDDEVEEDPSKYYVLEEVRQKHVKKFKASATDYKLRLRNLDGQFALNALPLLSSIFEDILAQMTRGVHPKDKVRFIVQAPDLDKPIALPFHQSGRIDGR